MQMIDPYWTVIPVMMVHYFASHPLGEYNLWRSRIVILLTWVWSIRLSHNYFRREKWQWGAREDWRFTDLSHQYGKHWWWASFFAVYVSQQVSILWFCFILVNNIVKELVNDKVQWRHMIYVADSTYWDKTLLLLLFHLSLELPMFW